MSQIVSPNVGGVVCVSTGSPRNDTFRVLWHASMEAGESKEGNWPLLGILRTRKQEHFLTGISFRYVLRCLMQKHNSKNEEIHVVDMNGSVAVACLRTLPENIERASAWSESEAARPPSYTHC